MLNFQKERKPSSKLILVIKCEFENKREPKFLSLGVLSYYANILVRLGVDFRLGKPRKSPF